MAIYCFRGTKMNQQMPAPSENNKHYLAIPCPPDKFAQFISGLLGKPQEIRRTFTGSFSLRVDDIENFYHLVEQRLQEQNQANLIQFQSVITYTDGSSVKIDSLEDLKSFAELRPLISCGISLTWVYLIKFQNRETEERQQIDIDMRAWHANKVRLIHQAELLYPDTFGPNILESTGFIGIRISHTARSWGIDIENMLSSHIENFLTPTEGKVRTLARKRSTLAGLISFFLSMIFFLGAGYHVIETWSRHINASYTASTKDVDSMSSIATKIDFIASPIISGQLATFAVAAVAYIFISLAGAIPIAVWLSGKADRPHPSFILLSRASENKMQAVMEEYNKSWFKFILCFIVNALAGVAGNALFALQRFLD